MAHRDKISRVFSAVHAFVIAAVDVLVIAGRAELRLRTAEFGTSERRCDSGRFRGTPAAMLAEAVASTD